MDQLDNFILTANELQIQADNTSAESFERNSLFESSSASKPAWGSRETAQTKNLSNRQMIDHQTVVIQGDNFLASFISSNPEFSFHMQ